LEPVTIAGGRPCEFVVFDPAGETRFTREFMRSKSGNTPFLDRTMAGRVEMVVLGDKVLLDREGPDT
jgi:dihydroorotase